jgi:hypothetical protein
MRGVPRMAKLIFSLMRQMFRFAVDRDIIEADPTASIRKARHWFTSMGNAIIHT